MSNRIKRETFREVVTEVMRESTACDAEAVRRLMQQANLNVSISKRELDEELSPEKAAKVRDAFRRLIAAMDSLSPEQRGSVCEALVAVQKETSAMN